MKNLIIILSIFILSSCTCESLIRRAERKCGKIEKRDTIYVQGAVLAPLTVYDTVFNQTHYIQKDTVLIHKNNLTIKYFYNTRDSLVYINGKCDTIRVPYAVKVPYTTLQIVYSVWHEYRRWILTGLVLLGIFVSIRIINGLLKPPQSK